MRPEIISPKLLEDIETLAASAGSAIMEVYNRGEVKSVLKADDSPLTEADMASHRVIVEGLSALTPSLPVLSEESDGIPYGERESWTDYWLVDPLDGTKEFLKRNGEFTVNIALVSGDRPVLGVVAAPAMGVSFSAARGLGAHRYEQDGRVPIEVASGEGSGKVRVAASRSHRGELLDGFLDRIGEHECVSMGSSLKLCMVAEGRADIYPRLGPTMEWDTAAAHAVVNEAGGRVTDLDGMELKYNKPDLHNPFFIVSAAPSRWTAYINEIIEKLK